MYEVYTGQHDGYGNKGDNQDKYNLSHRDGESIFGVFDGHGCLVDGIWKSDKLVRFISENLLNLFWQEREKGNSVTRSFVQSFDKMQFGIVSSGFDGGSTATLLHIDAENNHNVGYVGDSPIYAVTDEEVKDIIGNNQYHRLKTIFKNGEYLRLKKYFSESDLHYFSKAGYLNDVNITRFLGNIGAIGEEHHIPTVKLLKEKSDKYLLTTDGIDEFSSKDLFYILSLHGLTQDGIDEIIRQYDNRIKKRIRKFIKIFGMGSNLEFVARFDNATVMGVKLVGRVRSEGGS